jgi:hypothetical protein
MKTNKSPYMPQETVGQMKNKIGMSKGGMAKKGYAKGGMVKANCGASMKPAQKPSKSK